MPNDEKPKNIEIHDNDSLPTLFVDRMVIAHKTDGYNLLRFYTSIPGSKFVEQVRLMISDTQLKSIIDITSKILSHYPEKPAKD